MNNKLEQNIPHHIAFIMDGNRRWAKAKGVPTIEGHREGSLRLEKVIDQCGHRGVKVITVYAFSSENRNRSPEEIKGLMKLLGYFIRKKRQKLHKLGCSLQVLGDLNYLPDDLQKEVSDAVDLLKDNNKIHLNVALNYGAREEIAHAVEQIISSDVKEKITPGLVEQNLYTASQPDPDLLIRTGGERRLSNFLLWQVSYSELYFTDALWPDFNEEELDKALNDYSERQRRFGK
ncbi:di-trans,poly-cis-decaprenylcistransferase [Patescibacteria group bacterium]|nr:di-trans,poly-cis-decaprenylcistransferase [Patescibacteria group bacterium]